jgi:phage-related protein
VALTIGELVATIDANPSGMIRGLTVAELEVAGFRRDAEGQLRRVDGSLVSTAVAAREMGRAFGQSADQATLATHGLRRNAAGDLTNVLGGTRGVDDAFERMGQQMLTTSTLGSTAMHRLGEDADHGLGERGVSGRSRLATRALSVLRGGLSGVGSGAIGLVGKLAPLLAQLGSAIPLVAGLVGTLESIAPAATVAATGILAVVTVSATLKMAMHGVGDAVKAAFDPGTKPAELKAALAGLAPPARQFVLALRSLQPELKALQQSVQGEFFAGLGVQITNLASAVLPTLQVQLANTGMVLNGMASGAISAATQLGKSGVLGRALDGITNGLYDLQDVPGQAVTALGQLAAAGAPLFGRLTAAAGGAATSISAKLSAAFTSGGLSRAIDTAVGVIEQIGTVAGNIGGIIGSVFAAAGAAGGSWLGILADITGAMRTAFASPGVQAALGALFSTMRVLGETVGPLVAQALGVIAPVLTALGPPAQVLIKALGSALSPIIKALGPILLSAAQAVGALVVAASPLLGVIGDLVAQLLPVLMPVLDLLTGVFIDLAGPIKQIATALGSALKPVIAGLTTVIQDLVDQYLTIFLDLLGQFLPMLPVLIPVFIQLGKSVGTILAAVAPLLPQLASMAVLFMVQLLPAILPLIPPLAQLATALLIIATDVITKTLVPSLQFLIKFLGGLQKAFQPAIDAVKWLTTGIASLFEWLYDHLVGHSVIPDMVRAIVSWLAGLPGKALGALAGLPGALASVAGQAASRMVSAIRTGVTSAASAAGTLASRAKGAVGSLGGVLWGAGQSLISGFIGGIKSMLGSVKSTLGGLTNSLTSWKGPPGRDAVILRPAGRLVLGGFMAGIADQVPALRAQLGGLTAAMPGMGLGGGLAFAGAAGGASVGGGQQTVRVVLDVQGGQDAFTRAVRETVKVKGGGGPNSVQRAFGG